MLTLLWTSFILGVILSLIREAKKSKEQLKATIADCDASEELTNWRIANPDICICDDSWARELVIQRIVTYKYFLKTHPFIKDNGFTEFLRSLLDDHAYR